MTAGAYRAMSRILALVAGLVFGIGLAIAGMADPARVIGFLDPVARWDASLAFVIAGAVGFNAIAFRAIRRRATPWFDRRFHVPTRRDLDPRLVLGAAVFGIGWGLGGLCPGGAIVAAASGSWSAIGFVIAMLAGMTLRRRLRHR